MHKFEDFMGISNYEAFKLLVEAIRNDRLVCYVGAGLSLYSKRWGEPFEIVINNLIGYAKDSRPNSGTSGLKNKLNELYLLKYSLDRIKANNNDEKLKEAYKNLQESYSNVTESEKAEYEKWNLYPDIGDKIADIMEKSNLRMYKSEGMAVFNPLFSKVIESIQKNKEKDRNNKEINLSGRPYSFTSTYFLPYLGKKIKFITTNCDDSLEIIGTKLNEYDENQNSNWAKESNLKTLKEWKEKTDTNQIFYIHGHISESDSLVMTQRDYDKTYPEGSVVKNE